MFSEVTVVTPDSKIYSNPCSDSPCLNNGVCELDKSLGYRCLCPLQKAGSICHQGGSILKFCYQILLEDKNIKKYDFVSLPVISNHACLACQIIIKFLAPHNQKFK